MSEVLERPIEKDKTKTDCEVVYECPDCGYNYEAAIGCEREGYPAGTQWEEIPDDFPCPDCFVREKPDFLALVKQKKGGHYEYQ